MKKGFVQSDTEKYWVEIWVNATSDCQWVVSVCDENKDEVKRVSTHKNEDEAMKFGRETSQKLGLRLYTRDDHGIFEILPE